MSDIEYEYCESCDEEEDYIYQNVWHSVTKRMRWHWPDGILLHLFEDDDISVLFVLLDIVSKGIHCEKLAHLTSIEALENAIVNRPHKKYGYGRISEIRRLTNLIEHSAQKNLYTSAIVELHIEDTSALDEHIVRSIETQCPHLERIVFKKYIPIYIRKYFKQVRHIVLIADAIPCLDGILLEGTHTLEIHNASQFIAISILKHNIMFQGLEVKFVNVTLHDWQTQLLQSFVEWDNIHVRLNQQTIPYEIWRSQQNKRRRLLLHPETLNPKPFFH